MAKKKQETAASEDKQADLADALRFVSCAQLDQAPPHHKHCVLYDGMLYATNGVISAGHPVIEHMQCAPHTKTLLAALERCADQVSMIDQGRALIVRSGKFKATIQCMPLGDMPPIFADPPAAPVDDEKLRFALEVVEPLVSNGGQRIAITAVLLAPNYCVGTNGHVLFQAWHGLDAPEALLPKNSVKTVLAVKKKLTHIGASTNSVTFHFEDNSWIKTQLYSEQYPNFEPLFAKMPKGAWPFPTGFFDALRTLQPFAEDGVYFSNNKAHTHPKHEQGSSIELNGAPKRHRYNIDYLLALEKHFKSIEFGAPNEKAFVFGDNVRGILMPVVWKQDDDLDDDIPF